MVPSNEARQAAYEAGWSDMMARCGRATDEAIAELWAPHDASWQDDDVFKQRLMEAGRTPEQYSHVALKVAYLDGEQTALKSFELPK